MLAHDFVSRSDRPWHEDLSNGLTVDGEWKVGANGMRDGTVRIGVDDDAVVVEPASDGDAVSGGTLILLVTDAGSGAEAGTGIVFRV